MKKFLILFFIIIISIFVGYENPKLVEIPKKYIKFYLKELGLVKSFVSDNKNISKDKLINNFELFFGNSFGLKILKIRDFDEITASVIFEINENNQNIYNVFTQSGLNIRPNDLLEINLPITFFNEQRMSGGVKSVFYFDNEYYALISEKQNSCYFSSIISLKDRRKIVKSDCLPDTKKIDFSGLGGAFVKKENKILITIGVPTHSSEIINNLAQLNSIFGKSILIDKNQLKQNIENTKTHNVYSRGHRNPQGLVINKNKIFSLEHGPQGGDELNEIIEGGNYGWPNASLGTRYKDGKSYPNSHTELSFKEPLYTFLPAIAPSSLNICPSNLQEYYINYDCLLGLSLRGMSIIIFLIKNDRVISVEKIFLNKRLRHFGLDQESKLFTDSDGNFFISADNEGLFKVKFEGFR